MGSPLQVLDATFFVLFGWYCLAGPDRILKRRPTPVDFVRVLLLAMMFRLLNDLASLSPDPAVTLLLPWLWLWAVGQRYARLLGVGFALLTLGLLVVTPLQVDYHHYLMLPSLSPAEYASLLKRLPAPANQAFLRGEYPRALHDSLWYKGDGPAQEHAHLVRRLASVDGVPGRSGLDGSGRGGFTGLARRLVRPAPYLRIAVQPLALSPVRVLQSRQDQVPWYAPYPFVARRRLCAARGPHLADGFVAKAEPIRDWRKEALVGLARWPTPRLARLEAQARRRHHDQLGLRVEGIVEGGALDDEGQG